MHSSFCCRFQRIKNNTARLIFAVGRKVDADSLLERLHWLPVENERVVFKILLYVYKALNGFAPFLHFLMYSAVSAFPLIAIS